jgi:heme oxygenase
MTTLKELTKEHHDSAERSDFAELLVGGGISPALYLVYLNAQLANYTALENAVDLPKNLQTIFRSALIEKDMLSIQEEYQLEELPYSETLQSVREYVRYIVGLEISGAQRQLLAHVYVRHFGDLHGGQMIKKRVPGEGFMYQFEDRKGLIAGVRELIDNDMADEARICFEFAESMFTELAEKYDFETYGVEQSDNDDFGDDDEEHDNYESTWDRND